MSPRLLWIHRNYVHHSQAGDVRACFPLLSLTDAGWQVDLILRRDMDYVVIRTISEARSCCGPPRRR
jgi:hypothetical protein